MNRQMRRQQHFRIALLGGEQATTMSCRDARCPNYEQGWLTVLDPQNADHAIMARWIKQNSGRRFYKFASAEALEGVLRLEGDAILSVTEELRGALERIPPGMLVFLFPPGQQCFGEHLDREVLFTHQQGEVRRIHAKPLDWNEHFNEESYRIQRAIERG